MTFLVALGLGAAALPGVAAGSTGGVVAGSSARIAGVSCVKSCVSSDEAQAGSIVRVRGRQLQDAGRVVFLGRTGSADDVSAGVRRRDAKSTTVDVRVPAAARSGPVVLLDRDGSASKQSSTGITIDHGVDPRGPGSISGHGIVAKLESRTVYFGGKRGQRLAYSLTGSQPTPVRVDLIKVADGSVVQSWGPTTVAPGATQTIEWKGSSKVGDSRFQFQVFTGPAAASPSAPPTATAGARSAAGSGAPSVAGSFMYLQHIFPIRGRHNYGDAQNRYGAARAGHRHAGQDVLAACGTPVVAARGGKVISAGYGGDAGNYVAIHGGGGDYDMFYAHFRSTPLVRSGQTVYTGQLIGFIGETGDATVCHLHFELWQGAWWNGGRTIDPLAALKAWDALS